MSTSAKVEKPTLDYYTHCDRSQPPLAPCGFQLSLGACLAGSWSLIYAWEHNSFLLQPACHPCCCYSPWDGSFGGHRHPVLVPARNEWEGGERLTSDPLLNVRPILFLRFWSGIVGAQRLADFYQHSSSAFLPNFSLTWDSKPDSGWVLKQSPRHWNHSHRLFPPSLWLSSSPICLSLSWAKKHKDLMNISLNNSYK